MVDVVVDMLDGWRRHQSGRNASLLSFFFFLSIFPLLLVATTILGFVLQDNADLQQRIVGGALDNIPVLGQQLANDPTSLDGSIWVLIVGLATALWSATKAFVGLQVALDDIWEVDIDAREPMPVQRGRAILGLVIVGVAQVGTLAVTAVVNAAELPGVSRILLLVAGLAVNVGVLAFMYRFLTAASPDLDRRVAGVAVGGHRLQSAAVLRRRDREADHRQRRRHLRAVRPRAGPGHLARFPRHLRPDERRTECSHRATSPGRRSRTGQCLIITCLTSV